MSTFNEAGFLSDDVAKSVATFSKTFKAWKKLYFELNRFALKQFLSCEVNEKSNVQLLIYCCFYRMLTVYQSAYLLIERGNDTEAKALLRSLIETLFTLSLAQKDKTFVNKCVLVDDDKRIALLTDALEVNDKLRAEGQRTMLTTEHAKEMRDGISAYRLKHTKANQTALEMAAERKQFNKLKEELKVKFIARDAGLTDFYKLHYGYLCLFTHPAPEGMRDYLVLDKDGAVKDFKLGQRYKDAEANMRVAMVMLITALNPLAFQFNLAIEIHIKRFQTELNRVIEHSHTLRVSGD